MTQTLWNQRSHSSPHRLQRTVASDGNKTKGSTWATGRDKLTASWYESVSSHSDLWLDSSAADGKQRKLLILGTFLTLYRKTGRKHCKRKWYHSRIFDRNLYRTHLWCSKLIQTYFVSLSGSSWVVLVSHRGAKTLRATSRQKHS